jgi:hypothetical protein
MRLIVMSNPFPLSMVLPPGAAAACRPVLPPPAAAAAAECYGRPVVLPPHKRYTFDSPALQGDLRHHGV